MTTDRMTNAQLRSWRNQHRAEVEQWHKMTELYFSKLPFPIRDLNEDPHKLKLHHSSTHLGQGSRYYLADLEDIGLAWVRVSNHWGRFSTRSDVWDADARDWGSTRHNWKLGNGNEDARNSQAGYIPVRALRRHTVSAHGISDDMDTTLRAHIVSLVLADYKLAGNRYSDFRQRSRFNGIDLNVRLSTRDYYRLLEEAEKEMTNA